MMTEPPIIIERMTMVAPLGLRFWDKVSGTAIGDGLAVTAYPPDNLGRRVRAFPNRSGAYILRNVLGLRAVEIGAGDVDFWASPPATRPMIVEVVDELGRYQPFLFRVDLPVRGLFTWECGPAGAALTLPQTVPLFSTASRPIPAGMAVVRADLWDPDRHQGKGGPAAWAVLEATIAAPVLLRARALADGQGRIALIFPCPELADGSPGSLAGSLLGATGRSLFDQEWPVTLRAGYRPSDPVPRIPLLCDAFAALSRPADLWDDLEQTRPLAEQTLKFGQELVVRSLDDSGHTRPAVLLITAAGSPL